MCGRGMNCTIVYRTQFTIVITWKRFTFTITWKRLLVKSGKLTVREKAAGTRGFLWLSKNAFILLHSLQEHSTTILHHVPQEHAAVVSS